jgi:hypothetical protein
MFNGLRIGVGFQLKPQLTFHCIIVIVKPRFMVVSFSTANALLTPWGTQMWFVIIVVLLVFLFLKIFLFLFPNGLGWNFSVLGGFFHHGLLCWLTSLLGCHWNSPISESSSTRALIPHDTLLIPWGTQMWVLNIKQRKSKESGHTPWLTTLWRGRGAC